MVQVHINKPLDSIVAAFDQEFPEFQVWEAGEEYMSLNVLDDWLRNGAYSNMEPWEPSRELQALYDCVMTCPFLAAFARGEAPRFKVQYVKEMTSITRLLEEGGVSEKQVVEILSHDSRLRIVGSSAQQGWLVSYQSEPTELAGEIVRLLAMLSQPKPAPRKRSADIATVSARSKEAARAMVENADSQG
jgi:hypothetical protein